MNAKHLWGILLTGILMAACANGANAQSTVTVVGTGTVLAKPDRAQLGVTMAHIAPTTKMAMEEVNKMAQRVMTVLKNAKIEDKNISTASLTFRSEYEYAGKRILIGQRAEQGITFFVDDIGSDSAKISAILDQLININGIELNQVSFSVKNNTEYFARSRELAFQKAFDKAKQYADLSKMKLGKAQSIAEEGAQQIVPINRYANNMINESAKSAADTAAIIPTGELEITTRITAVFALE